MSEQIPEVEVLFLHEFDRGYRVIACRGEQQLFQAVLEVKETTAGPRPRRFLLKDGTEETPRDPDEFVELARRAERIRISQQTSSDGRQELHALLDGYQLSAKTVRTCRYCAEAGRYALITTATAIHADDEHICRSCATAELERELAYQGELTAAAKDRLTELLFEVQDLSRITDLLAGGLDPELTRFDTISATVDDVDLYETSTLDLHPTLRSVVTDRFAELLPVQSLAVDGGALAGQDQLIVSATATGKTLIGELAGIDRCLRGSGKLLFLVPLVALANQKYADFEDAYGDLVDVTIRVGGSRVRDGGAAFDPDADVIVGTYEGIDHALRVGQDLGDIGTVVIDEIHTLKDASGRGHRLDGLISRLKYATDADTQWLYLSATVGNPEELAAALEARLIEFEERPVPIDRHVTFADGQEKPRIINRLVKREFDQESSKGYRGQTIIFTNSRRRCHELARQIEYSAAPYHAGLSYKRRSRVEAQFADQDLAAVVTTAALAAGVDFPASQVIFDSLAMGIEWLSVQEFEQMLGRAGRPDYHDQGTVYVLVEPGGSYHHSMEATEDETAFTLLKGEMEPVRPTYAEGPAVEETLANIVVGGRAAKELNDQMAGEVPTKHAVGKLLEYGFIDGLTPTPLGRAVTEHFLAPGLAFTLLDGIRNEQDPFEIVAAAELYDTED